MLKALVNKVWVIPLISTIIIVMAFISLLMQLYPVPYYIGMVVPFVLGVNVLVLIFHIVQQHGTVLKALLCYVIPFSLGCLWLIQTA